MELFILNSKKEKQKALRALMAVMGEEGMEMILRKRTDHGTKEQERWFNILCRMIADENGDEPESIKYIIKEKVFGRILSEAMGVTVEFVPRSNYEGRAGYSKLIECAYRTGAELGIVLPEPKKQRG